MLPKQVLLNIPDPSTLPAISLYLHSNIDPLDGVGFGLDVRVIKHGHFLQVVPRLDALDAELVGLLLGGELQSLFDQLLFQHAVIVLVVEEDVLQLVQLLLVVVL